MGLLRGRYDVDLEAKLDGGSIQGNILVTKAGLEAHVSTRGLSLARIPGLGPVLATPLVLSVHSVVSWDFAMSIGPGWHATILAPYFVAGAIFSGVAMVITLTVPLRKLFKLEAYLTVRHFDAMAKLILLTSLTVLYAYLSEFFMA